MVWEQQTGLDNEFTVHTDEIDVWPFRKCRNKSKGGQLATFKVGTCINSIQQILRNSRQLVKEHFLQGGLSPSPSRYLNCPKLSFLVVLNRTIYVCCEKNSSFVRWRQDGIFFYFFIGVQLFFSQISLCVLNEVAFNKYNTQIYRAQIGHLVIVFGLRSFTVHFDN